MREEYDFTNAIKNPHAEELKKKKVSIRLDESILTYFKEMANDSGIAYQTLINLFLRDCVSEQKKINLSWTENQK